MRPSNKRETQVVGDLTAEVALRERRRRGRAEQVVEVTVTAPYSVHFGTAGEERPALKCPVLRNVDNEPSPTLQPCGPVDSTHDNTRYSCVVNR
jgi:hypothetical protein